MSVHRHPLEVSARASDEGDGSALVVVLATEGSTYVRQGAMAVFEPGAFGTQLVDGVRKEMAERYLEDASLSLTDIAFLLGYSEQSAFARAYKRWTGHAPARTRQAAAG